MALALKNTLEYNGHEIVIERPDGQRRTTLAYANPISDEGGKLLGAVNVLVDISDRKRAEDALKQADRSKNEFLATLAHELRNPLAPIRAAVKILQLKSKPTAESSMALEVIERQTGQMTRLIDDLLDIARITSNKLDLRREPIELSEVLDAAVETSRPLIEQREHELIVEAPAEPIRIDADLVRLAQVISNLLNNAAKYTEPGGRISLRAGREKSEAVVEVSDTGMGIAPEMLPQVFDMFTQAERAANGSPGGLGIGLTLVKRLVEMHGGAVTVHSEGRGKGSKFAVRVPIASTESGRLKMRAQDQPPVATENAPPLRILVVDDNHDSADSLGMLLKLLGNDVRIVNDGLAAVDVTFVVPTTKAVPDAGTDVAVTSGHMPSTFGAKLTTALHLPASLFTVIGAWHSIVGSGSWKFGVKSNVFVSPLLMNALKVAPYSTVPAISEPSQRALLTATSSRAQSGRLKKPP
jgi:signal transduction histidine kinase